MRKTNSRCFRRNMQWVFFALQLNLIQISDRMKKKKDTASRIKREMLLEKNVVIGFVLH